MTRSVRPGSVEGRARPRARPLPDHVAPGLRILFVGINPSLGSGIAGHHFASKGNPFWRLLHAARLTPTLLDPTEDASVVGLGLGLTNVCRRPTRSADELTRAELEAGAAELLRKVEALRPAVLALVGLTLAPLVLPASSEAGPGARRAAAGGARAFVLPNPSGRNAAFPGFESKRVWYARLRAFAERQTASTGPRRYASRTRPRTSRIA